MVDLALSKSRQLYLYCDATDRIVIRYVNELSKVTW